MDHFNWLTGYVRIIFQKKWGLIEREYRSVEYCCVECFFCFVSNLFYHGIEYYRIEFKKYFLFLSFCRTIFSTLFHCIEYYSIKNKMYFIFLSYCRTVFSTFFHSVEWFFVRFFIVSKIKDKLKHNIKSNLNNYMNHDSLL